MRPGAGILRLILCFCVVAATMGHVQAEEDAPDSRQRARIHTELGAAYFSQGQTAVALEELNEAVRSDSRYAPAYNMLGLLYMSLAEDARAEENFKNALSADANDPEAHNNYGLFLCSRGKPNEGIPHFMAALKNSLYATPDKAWLNAGICSRKKNNDVAAEEFLLKSLRFQSQQPQALYHLADIYFERGSYEEAHTLLVRLVQLSKPTAESLWLGVRIEHKRGDRNAEASYGLQLRKMFPDSPEARALHRRGRE